MSADAALPHTGVDPLPQTSLTTGTHPPSPRRRGTPRDGQRPPGKSSTFKEDHLLHSWHSGMQRRLLHCAPRPSSGIPHARSSPPTTPRPVTSAHLVSLSWCAFKARTRTPIDLVGTLSVFCPSSPRRLRLWATHGCGCIATAAACTRSARAHVLRRQLTRWRKRWLAAPRPTWALPPCRSSRDRPHPWAIRCPGLGRGRVWA